MATQKTIRIGNSVGITIPSKIVKDLAIRVGDTAEITRPEPDIIQIKFIASKQLFMNLPNLKSTINNPL